MEVGRAFLWLLPGSHHADSWQLSKGMTFSAFSAMSPPPCWQSHVRPFCVLSLCRGVGRSCGVPVVGCGAQRLHGRDLPTRVLLTSPGQREARRPWLLHQSISLCIFTSCIKKGLQALFRMLKNT